MKNAFMLIAFFTIFACDMKNKNNPISEEDVVKIAMNEVEHRDDWLQSAMECEVKQIKEGFSIVVWRVPKIPGGYRTLVLSQKGDIISYHKGK